MQGSRPLILLLASLLLAGVIFTLITPGNPGRLPPPGVPSRVVMVNGYPEFHVDDKPFFMHSAAFYYYRTPRGRWEESLSALKSHGINTIDLYIIWNWHQPTEDTLDLDGHTLPGRDLKGLLKLISDMKFKLSVRPGPFICSEWKNGGYPDWLLSRPEYQMPQKDILEGRYPRWSALQYAYSEKAAEAYLNNPTHLRYTRRWYQDVMDVVRPYLSTRGGNVILLQIDDDQGLDKLNYNGPKFWEYMKVLRQYLQEAAGDRTIPVYFNPADMRVTAASSAPELGTPFWAMGQYYQEEGFGSDVLKAEDTSHAKYLTEILKTQPGFPPFFIEYQAGWFAGAEDVRARATDPTNTLLSSRFLFQNGVKGINYFPLQDTLFPQGYECPWSNYFYSWESAIGLEGNLRPRAEASIRNGLLIEGMGSALAAAHYVADIGVVHTVGTYPQERLTHEDIAGVFFRTATAMQYAFFNHVSAELVDLDYQSLQQLGRYRMILLPVPSGSMYKDGKIPGYMALSLRAQAVLIDYVKEGGTLVAYPAPPLGESLKALFPVQSTKALAGNEKMIPLQVAGKSAATPGPLFLFPEASADSRVTPFAAVSGDAAGVLGYENRVGKGLAIVLGTEFDRWVPLQSGSSELDSPLPKQPALTQAEMIEIGQVLEALLQAADISRSVRLEGVSSGFPAQQPYASMLAANEPAALGGGSQYGFLSITNFDGSSHVIRPSIKDPRTGTRLTLPELEIAARDALMLPLRLGFETLGVGGMEPEDEIVYSTAEITAARAMDGALHLDLYSKGKSSLMLRLAQAPSGEIHVGSMSLPVSYAASRSKTLSIEIPPPADRSGRQTLIIPITGLKGIPSPPQMSPKSKVDVRPTIRIPVRSDTAYDLIPPTRVALTGEAVDFSFIHPPDCKGKCKAKVTVQDLNVSEVNPEKIPAFTIRAPFERT